jgi:hypothetical protein
MTRMAAAALALLLLTGCESDKKKYDRLSSERAIAQIMDMMAREDYDAAEAAGVPQDSLRVLGRALSDARRDLDLAERAFERFMR